MNAGGTVKRAEKIAHLTGGGPVLANDNRFGSGVAAIGDLDGDGVIELAVGSETDGTGGNARGAVHVLFLQPGNTSPVFTSPTTVNVPENATTVMTVIATDAEAPPQTVVLSIVGGADRDRFRLSGEPNVIDFSGPIDYPGAAFTSAPNINNSRLMVGHFSFPPPPGQNSQSQAFLFDGASFSTIRYPQSQITLVGDLNNENAIVGTYLDAQSRSHGYVLKNGQFQTFDYPGARHTSLGGINDYGSMVGWYALGESRIAEHSFVYDGTGFTAIQYPGASTTYAHDINNDGIVIGWYEDGTNPDRGYSFDGTTYSPIEFPGAVETIPWGINSDGVIVGTCVLDEMGGTKSHGFVFDGSAYRLLDHPDGIGSQLWDINDVGDVTGMYWTAEAPFGSHVFTATTSSQISVPASLIFKAPPNFESPNDANGDSVYEVVVQASDGSGGITVQTILVTVTPVNDNPPVITTAGAMNVPENSTAVLTVAATDADLPSHAVTFSIIGGADQAKFNITSGGMLSFNTPPDFESPADANGDNVYVVIVQASDGSLPDVQAILVTITNIAEPLLAGDYNASGTVDAADYVVWRRALGSSIVLPNDTTPGTVTQMDYNVWRSNFGRTAASGASAPGVAAQADGPLPNLNVDTDLGAAADSALVDGYIEKEPSGRTQGSFVVPALAGSDRLKAELRTSVIFRSARSEAVVVSTLHDHALQAWLTTKPKVRWSDSDAQGDDELRLIREQQDESETVDALDLAFATM